MSRKVTFLVLVLATATLLLFAIPVRDDPLVRMPGTQPQPEGSVSLESPNRCLNCHGGYNSAVEPGFNWKGSMMAQAGRDPIFWACLTVAAQDAIWATGSPNATDLCLRCHSPKGWLEGRSDPTNGSALAGADFDGVQCDFCHRMVDPFFESTYAGLREGSDWVGYWDETGASGTPSQPAADATYGNDLAESASVLLFNGAPFYGADNLPFSAEYRENASGQYFVSSDSAKRASFADAAARHRMFYSRYHKSKYFCATCHDVSNPVLANLGADPASPLPTEVNSAYSYFHVERTFSEFMLSDYGQPGGAAGLGPFAPGVFDTSLPNDYVGKCQDCHLRDVSGAGCTKNGSPVRPGESVEHPNSGLPLHDLTGGNIWVSTILASTVAGSPNYDSTNDTLLNRPGVLTMDLQAGQGIDAEALLAGADRARQQLELAASIENLSYDPATGALSFQIQNQTGHKLISGFPEGRRMYLNVRVFAGGALIFEINPYDAAAATLKGLHYDYQPGFGLPAPAALTASESYSDGLVYQMHPSSTLTGETETFHFVLADDRHKDNRIPPKGFRISEAGGRLSVPRLGGADAPTLYQAAEYAGGYDDVSLVVPSGADYLEVTLYYQTTSREYMEFLRDEINANPANLTLPASAYVIATDPFFDGLRAWGDTIWDLWLHNRNLDGATPFPMAQATIGAPPPPDPGDCTAPGAPVNLLATGGRKSVTLDWTPGDPAPDGGYRIFYDQADKLQYRDSVSADTTSFRDNRLQRQTEYCYRVTAWSDCDGDGVFTGMVDLESGASNQACATTK